MFFTFYYLHRPKNLLYLTNYRCFYICSFKFVRSYDVYTISIVQRALIYRLLKLCEMSLQKQVIFVSVVATLLYCSCHMTLEIKFFLFDLIRPCSIHFIYRAIKLKSVYTQWLYIATIMTPSCVNTVSTN